MTLHRVAARRQCLADNAYNPPSAILATFLPITTTPVRPSIAAGSASHRSSWPRSFADVYSTARVGTHPPVENSNGDRLASDDLRADQSSSMKRMWAQPDIRKHVAWPRYHQRDEASKSGDVFKERHDGDKKDKHARQRSKGPTTVKRLKVLHKAAPEHELSTLEASKPVLPQTILLEEQKSVMSYIFRGSAPESHHGAVQWRDTMLSLGEYAAIMSGKKVIGAEATARERARLNYEAKYLSTPDSPIQDSAKALRSPWAIDLAQRSKMSGTDLLDAEIASFAEYIALSPAEVAARQAVSDKVLELIGPRLGRGTGRPKTLRIQGSELTGLATPTSDMDFRLCRRDGPQDYEKLTGTIEYFAKLMESPKSGFVNVEFRAAKFPIISAQHEASGIDVQIVAAPSTKRQADITMQYLAEIPHLREVYLLLRTALGVRGLVDVYHGGTGAYGLLMMLVAALNRRGSSPPASAGEAFTQFLDFYSTFDTGKNGVSVSPPKLFRKHEAWEVPVKDLIDAARRRKDPVKAGQWAIGQTRLYQPYLFCLQDPADPTNDLGRKSNAIKHVQKTLQLMRATLGRDMKRIAQGKEEGWTWTEDSLLEPHLGRVHEIYLARRNKMEEFGARVLKGDQEDSGEDGESARDIVGQHPMADDSLSSREGSLGLAAHA